MLPNKQKVSEHIMLKKFLFNRKTHSPLATNHIAIEV